jgi:hypothetical protein
MKTKIKPELILFCDGAHGQYIPKRFACKIVRSCVSGVSQSDLDYLACGPGGCLDDELDTLIDGESVRGEYYWDVWTTVCDNAIVTDHNGNKFFMWQDDDLWLVPQGWEMNEAGEWEPMAEIEAENN